MIVAAKISGSSVCLYNEHGAYVTGFCCTDCVSVTLNGNIATCTLKDGRIVIYEKSGNSYQYKTTL